MKQNSFENFLRGFLTEEKSSVSSKTKLVSVDANANPSVIGGSNNQNPPAGYASWDEYYSSPFREKPPESLKPTVSQESKPKIEPKTTAELEKERKDFLKGLPSYERVPPPYTGPEPPPTKGISMVASPTPKKQEQQAQQAQQAQASETPEDYAEVRKLMDRNAQTYERIVRGDPLFPEQSEEKSGANLLIPPQPSGGTPELYSHVKTGEVHISDPFMPKRSRKRRLPTYVMAKTVMEQVRQDKIDDVLTEILSEGSLERLLKVIEKMRKIKKI